MRPDAILEDAIALTAEEWKRSEANGSVPNNINLHDRVALFGPTMRKQLFAHFPNLRAADDQVMLFVVAEGIARSGSVSRANLEKALGIILPPEA